MSKHTPGPWSCKFSGYEGELRQILAGDAAFPRVGNCELEVVALAKDHNAEFIVRACNAHDDLLEACQQMFDAFGGEGLLKTFIGGVKIEAFKLARIAIAKAGSEPTVARQDSEALRAARENLTDAKAGFRGGLDTQAEIDRCQTIVDAIAKAEGGTA